MAVGRHAKRWYLWFFLVLKLPPWGETSFVCWRQWMPSYLLMGKGTLVCKIGPNMGVATCHVALFFLGMQGHIKYSELFGPLVNAFSMNQWLPGMFCWKVTSLQPKAPVIRKQFPRSRWPWWSTLMFLAMSFLAFEMPCHKPRNLLGEEETSMCLWLASGWPPQMKVRDLRASNRGQLSLGLV